MTVTTNTQQRHARMRLQVEPARDIFGRAITLYATHTYGDMLDNVLVLLKHRPALRALLGFERRVARFNKLDSNLKTLAITACAAVIGCSWCLDFSYFLAHSEGRDLAKLKEVPRWRDSSVFSPVERLVLEYTEAMTVTPPAVTDRMVHDLTAQLGEPATIELTMMIAIENERSRLNSALGLTSQGFSDRCGLQDA